ncbi:GLUG motif-containing protein [Candidatus Neomarinimicrobiota bacterium]
MKKHACILFLFLGIKFLTAQTATAPTLGAGTVADPYQIATLENLYWLSQQEGNSDATGLYWSRNYLQTADINATNTTTWGSGNGNSGWYPIGTNSNHFTGSYDGQNNYISALYVNRWEYGGLFGYLEGASIQNVQLPSVNVVSPGYYSAALAHITNGGTVDNCWSTGTVSGSRMPAGLIGRNYGGTITNSYSGADVTATCSGGFCRPGGFVSQNENGGTIDNCYSTGTVSGYETPGGFVSINNYLCSITNSYSTGNVIGGNRTGGFVGNNGGTINACFSTGDVSGCYEAGAIGSLGEVGAFVGITGSTSQISNCYSLGNATRNTGALSTEIGAFVGEAGGTIQYCYSIGSVYYTDTTDPTDKGFVGNNNNASYESNFWDSEASNQTTATGATAKTTADMQTLCTFTDDATVGLSTPVWDFETNPNDDAANIDYWDIDLTKTINTGYPFLSWENGTAIALPVGVEPLGDPRQVSTLEHLLWISENSSSWSNDFEQTVDIDASSTSTWNCGEGFSPIGNITTNFTGSYDGQYHTIDGLFIDRPETDYIGLFGYILDGTIKNLGVTNVNITGDYRVGGLVGGNFASVINCYSTGSVTGGDEVGGLVGVTYNNVVSNSYSTANVQGNDRVGGLVGANFNTTTVSNCYSRGDVTRPSGTSPNFGAFCGYNNQSTIEYCYSTGSVDYIGDTNPTDKGFVGFDNDGSPGTFTNNFWDSQASNQDYDNSDHDATIPLVTATAKTTTPMKDVATFTLLSIGDLSAPVWDFETDPNDDAANEDYWDMDNSGGGKVRSLGKIAAINNGYPFLSWENGEDTSLPVELSSFTVEATNQGVLCSWTTESETENLGFILERKTEGTAWKEIASYKTDDGLLGQGSISSATDYEYLDVLVEPNTTYEYRLSDVDYNEIMTYHATREVTFNQAPLSSKVERFTVLPAYPNPFNPSTTIKYGLDDDSKVTIAIYDIAGNLISTLVNTEQTQGWHSVIWNGTNQQGELSPAGIYLSRITSGNEVKTAKLMLLK